MGDLGQTWRPEGGERGLGGRERDRTLPGVGGGGTQCCPEGLNVDNLTVLEGQRGRQGPALEGGGMRLSLETQLSR